jgi:carbamoyl-phosphate synthase large subunit
LPQTTRELWTLSENLEEFEQIGVKVVVSSLNSIRVANDKFLLVEKAKQIGIPYPRYFLTSTEEEFLAALKEIGYPQKKVVIKPRVSNGMRGLRIIVEDVWDVQRFLNEKPEGVEITLESLLQILRKGQWPELLVTEYLEGFEYSVDVFRNKKGSIAIPRLRKQIRSGITFEAEVDLREDLIEYSKKLSEALNLFYCFGFQYKLDSDGVPKILECNPRVQGTMVVSTFAGFNMIYYSVKEALGFEVDIREKVLKNGLQFKRFWGGICIENGQFIGRI